MTRSFWTSTEVGKRFDVNTQIIVALHEIGKAFAALLTLCGIMNMVPPLAESSFQSLQIDHVIPAYKAAAESDMHVRGT